MTLTELRYIVTLSETGHFRKAAELCNVSQPTLSIAVKKLEEELGVDLFERTRQRVSPTPIGERVVDQARTVLQESRNLVSLAEQGKDPLGSVLSLGAIFTVGPYLFPRLVTRLHEFAPQMPLFIEESYTYDLRARLVSGELDAIFVALPFTETDVVTRSLYDEPFVVVLPKDHPLGRESRIAPDALAEHRRERLLAVRVLSDALWKQVKDGTFTGFSIGGSARRREETIKVAKRSAQNSKPKTQNSINRLHDMVVEEVSLVDRAANKQRFLIVKRSDSMGKRTKKSNPPSNDGIQDAIKSLEVLAEAGEALAEAGEAHSPELVTLASRLLKVSERIVEAAESAEDDGQDDGNDGTFDDFDGGIDDDLDDDDSPPPSPETNEMLTKMETTLGRMNTLLDALEKGDTTPPKREPPRPP